MAKLIISLDVDNLNLANTLIEKLSPLVDIFKIGPIPYLNFGDQLIKKISSLNKKVFLDLKFHDIPNTIKGAVEAAVQKNIFMLNVHCLGGPTMLKAAVEGIAGQQQKPILIGVTILTSMGIYDMQSLGLSENIQNEVLKLAKLAKEAGLNGVVASAQEATVIKQTLGKDFLVITPGVRPSGKCQDDQKRILTPKQAILAGADYLVVGRPIIQATDPVKITKEILAEME